VLQEENSMNTKLFQKDFICTPDWSVEDLNTVLDLAFRLKGEFAMGVPQDHILRAKTLDMLFLHSDSVTSGNAGLLKAI
jgi:ornithine carbamoyltransferase